MGKNMLMGPQGLTDPKLEGQGLFLTSVESQRRVQWRPGEQKAVLFFNQVNLKMFYLPLLVDISSS